MTHYTCKKKKLTHPLATYGVVYLFPWLFNSPPKTMLPVNYSSTFDYPTRYAGGESDYTQV